MNDELFHQIEESLKIVKTGKDSKGNSYNDFGRLNQAAWIGERSGILIEEIKRLRIALESTEKE